MDVKISPMLLEWMSNHSSSMFDSNFFSLAYKKVSSFSKAQRPLFLDDEDEMLEAFEKTDVQDGSLALYMRRALLLAEKLVGAKGEIDQKELERSYSLIQERLYPVGPHHQFDAPRQRHLLRVLALLKEREFQLFFKGLSRPLNNPYADQLVRQTLRLSEKIPITDALVKRSVLSAWLSYLRQNVGSCFATAPAIIIHEEQPLRFLQDLKEILDTGQLKRTFGGVEYAFPMSPSWGSGDLRKPLLSDASCSRIANSPGFILALEAAGCFEGLVSPTDRVKHSVSLVREALALYFPEFRGGIITVEQILRWVLLKAYGLTEDHLKELQEKTKSLVKDQLLFQMHGEAVFRNKRKEEIALHLFETRFEAAKARFVGIIDNPLLKTWEFTLASFSENKSEFARWNLYASLGMHPNEEGGVGQCIYRFLDEKIKSYQKELEQLQGTYEQLFIEMRSLEARMKSASSEQQAQWIRVEHQGRLNEYRLISEKREALHEKGQHLSKLFEILLKQYDHQFPQYFQEIYDANMQEVRQEAYDDSPAGFRLLAKHGRQNPLAWTLIYTSEQFIDVLVEFFTITENEISLAPELDGLKEEFSRLITEIVLHLRTKEFIESAFHRTALAHKVKPVQSPLENLEKIIKKPWAYTSGGTMGTLVSCLYSREKMPTETSRWVESESELLAFFLDTLKTLPHSITKPYLDNPYKSMLGFSPTHAFVVKPGMFPFFDGWKDDRYSYTWIKQYYINPALEFLSHQRLVKQMVDRLMQEILVFLPSEYHPTVRLSLQYLPHEPTPRQFRNAILSALPKRFFESSFLGRSFDGQIDAVLSRSLPLFSRDELKSKVMQIIQSLHSVSLSKQVIEEFFLHQEDSWDSLFFTSEDLKRVTETLLILSSGEVAFPKDLHEEVSRSMQKLSFSMPRPILFADTNWIRDYFGFSINPGSEEFELWRFDYTGSRGFPISEWKKWLRGEEKAPWGLYSFPYEYDQ